MRIRYLVYVLVIIVLLPACKNSYEDTPTIDPPRVTTGVIDLATKTISGNIADVSDGIVDHGHVWARQNNPSINDSKSSLGATGNTGTFTSTFNDLVVGEIYFVAAYVLDNLGKVTLGEVKSFEAPAVPYIISTGIYSRIDGETEGTIVAEVVQSGDLQVKEFGHIWSTTNPPSLTDNKTSFSILTGNTYSSTIEPAFGDLGKTIFVSSYLEDEDGGFVFGEIDSFRVSDVWVEINLPGGFAPTGGAAFVKNNIAHIVPDAGFIVYTYDGQTNSFSDRLHDDDLQFVDVNFIVSDGLEAYGFAKACSQILKYNEQTPGNDFWSSEQALQGEECSANSIGFSIGDKIYFGYKEGSGFVPVNSDMYSYDPVLNTVSSFEEVASGGNPASSPIAFSLNGKGYVFGGSPPAAATYVQVDEYDPVSNTWTILSEEFKGSGNLSGAAFFTIGGKAYITGGKGIIGPTNVLYEFDPSASPQWQEKQAFPGVARVGAYSFSINGRGYLGNGVDENLNTQNDFWTYIP